MNSGEAFSYKNISINKKLDRILAYLDKDSSKLTLDDIFSAISNYYEGLILNMPANVYWFNADGLTAGCNQNVLSFYGLNSVDEFIGLNFDQQGEMAGWDETTTASFKADTFDVFKTGKAKRNVKEPPIKGPDGKLVYFLTTRVPIFSSEGKIIAVVGISTDITELRNTQMELIETKKRAEEANKAKTEFVQNMQHDIRTPLASIMLLLLALKDRKMDEEVRETFTLLEQVCQQLTNLCRDFAKTRLNEDGKESLKQEEINIRDIVTESINTHQVTAANKDIALDLHIADSVPTHIISDESKLRRIFLNLLSNAIKFTDQGKVSLSIGMDESNALLSMKVSDTGIGINKDKLPFVFEKYVRDDTGDSHKYPGTGLGLYFVKKYVEDLGGRLWVESEFGKGSVFSVDLPKG
jgi:two-component system aerobic respiration control sensor histidine kinase ArcB